MTEEHEVSGTTDSAEESPENPDQSPTNSNDDQTTSDNGTGQVRTDGGTVANAPDQHAQRTTQSPESVSPTNIATHGANIDGTSTAGSEELFAGTVSLEEVLEFYLETNPWGVQPGTVKSYRSRLRHFEAFCSESDIQDLRNVRPDTLDEFQHYLREDTQLQATSSIKSTLAVLRKFLQYCERRGVFSHGFHKLVILPTISKHDGQDERWLARESAKEIVEHLGTYEPFTKEHVVWAILSETGIRQSTLHAFDLEDYDASDRYLAAVNREETDTRLKNGYGGEREIGISKDAARALDKYIEVNRNPVTDDYGREPLLTTRNGRLQKATIRQYVYAWSRPCALGGDCPVGEDPDSCDAAQTKNAAYNCPESISPHPVRRGYITHLRANGVPTEDVISERCDANPETIERWYDMSTESDRREARREYVEDL